MSIANRNVLDLDDVELDGFMSEKIYIDFRECRSGPRGTGLLRLLYGITGQPLTEEAIKFATEIDEKIINNHLYTFTLPVVDFLIRTSGEKRISNFLLWQIAYAELYFTDVLWPDFRKKDFYEAILNYQSRERRFGKTSEQIESKSK